MSETAFPVLAASGGTPLVPLRAADWTCTTIKFEDDDNLTVRFEARFGGGGANDWVEVRVFRRKRGQRAFRHFDHCAIRYRGNLEFATAETRRLVGDLVVGVGAAVDELLSADPEKTIADAMGKRRGGGTIVFGRDAMREILSPYVVEGVPLPGGWELRDIYPSSRATDDGRFDLCLDFGCGEHDARFVVVIGAKDSTRSAFLRTANFAVSHYETGDDAPPGAELIRVLVGFALTLRDNEETELIFPDVTHDVADALLPAPRPDAPKAEEEDDLDGDMRELNLAISSECGQACVFCSVKDREPAHDPPLARLYTDLRTNAESGVRRLRVNGYDPLQHPEILDILAYARRLGYVHVEIYSPCTRLADRDFAEAVVAELPGSARFFVPFYGTTADAHDQVVGRPGAFAELETALDHIVALRGTEAVILITAVTSLNVESVPEIMAYATARGFRHGQHLTFPSTESRRDRYFESAADMRDAARVLAAGLADHPELAPLRMTGIAPCYLTRAMAARGVGVKTWLQLPESRPTLPGTDYRSARIRHRNPSLRHDAFAAATVPCPEVDGCVLAEACSQQFLRSYVERFGLQDLAAVSLVELLGAV